MEFVRYNNERVYGEYRPDENKILVNVDYIRADLHPSESVNTVAHEGRHAYQSFALNNEGFHRDAAEVERWRANDKKYLSADKYGQKRYREQPLEADAWPYGDYVAERLTSYD